MEVIVFDALIPSLQLDWIGHQQWINDTFYIKQIFDTSLSQVHTFYQFERGRYGLAYGILGEWKCQNPVDASQLKQIKSNFNALVANYMFPSEIFSEFYETISRVPLTNDISLLMWVANQEKNVFSMISKNFKHVYLSKRTVDNGKLKRFFHGESRNQAFEVHHDTLSDLKQLVLPTNSYGHDAIAQFEMKVHDVRHPDIFSLSGLINESYYEEDIRATRIRPRALIMDFESFKNVKVYTLMGLDSQQIILDKILMSLPEGFNAFEVKLVYSELICNAFVHGNKKNPEIPIKVIVSFTNKYCYIEVYDMREASAHIKVPTSLDPMKLLEENGRGLFLVQSVSESVYVDQNSTTAKLKKREVSNA